VEGAGEMAEKRWASASNDPVCSGDRGFNGSGDVVRMGIGDVAREVEGLERWDNIGGDWRPRRSELDMG
jgi:hypothetical protein